MTPISPAPSGQPIPRRTSWFPSGPSNGDYQVWIGLRGRLETSYQTWHGATLTLDTNPPVIVVTNPAATLVGRSVIQLQGYVSEPLVSLTYDLTNAAGVMTNQEAFIIGQHTDTNTWKFTTSYFQAYDVVLTNGENAISLRATDLAGNTATTNLTLALDEGSATNPPVVTILWPPQDTRVAGTNTVLQGLVDDDTASVAVSVGSNTYTAVVERGGRFSVPDLPLLESTNAIAVAVTNRAGIGATMVAFGIATQTLFSMDPFSASTIFHGLGTVTGSITEPGLDLWVNGVQAVINPDSSWQADNVPLHNEAGTGQFYIAAYPNGWLPIGPPVAAQWYPSHPATGRAGVRVFALPILVKQRRVWGNAPRQCAESRLDAGRRWREHPVGAESSAGEQDNHRGMAGGPPAGFHVGSPLAVRRLHRGVLRGGVHLHGRLLLGAFLRGRHYSNGASIDGGRSGAENGAAVDPVDVIRAGCRGPSRPAVAGPDTRSAFDAHGNEFGCRRDVFDHALRGSARLHANGNWCCQLHLR